MMRNIFLIDHEPVIANIFAAIFSKAGYRTSTFTHLAQAIEASKRVTPDILIVDADGKRSNGYEQALLFRRACPDCKVLVFAGRSCATESLSEQSPPVDGTHVKFLKNHPADFLAKAGPLHNVDSFTESSAQGELPFTPHSLWMSKETVGIQNQSERL